MKWTFFLFILAGLTIQSCDGDGFCVNGNGNRESDEFYVSDFDGVQLSCSADIYLRQGSDHEVIIKAQPNILDEMDLSVRNDVLDIDVDGCIRSHKQIEVFITMPNLTYLNIDGSGDIVTENNFEIDDLEININGSGDIDLALEADDVNVDIDGSGDVELYGTGNTLDIKIDGSGNVNAFDFPVDECDIHVKGSGDCRVYPYEYLNVRIDGSGNVYYKGNPEKDITIDGSGDVINAN